VKEREDCTRPASSLLAAVLLQIRCGGLLLLWWRRLTCLSSLWWRY